VRRAGRTTPRTAPLLTPFPFLGAPYCRGDGPRGIIGNHAAMGNSGPERDLPVRASGRKDAAKTKDARRCYLSERPHESQQSVSRPRERLARPKSPSADGLRFGAESVVTPAPRQAPLPTSSGRTGWLLRCRGSANTELADFATECRLRTVLSANANRGGRTCLRCPWGHLDTRNGSRVPPRICRYVLAAWPPETRIIRRWWRRVRDVVGENNANDTDMTAALTALPTVGRATSP
jgi:hypothetical protein